MKKILIVQDVEKKHKNKHEGKEKQMAFAISSHGNQQLSRAKQSKKQEIPTSLIQKLWGTPKFLADFLAENLQIS